MIINGEERDFKDGITIDEMLIELDINKDNVVVEVNFEIVSKEEFIDRVLNKGDKVEIVAFVGGG